MTQCPLKRLAETPDKGLTTAETWIMFVHEY